MQHVVINPAPPEPPPPAPRAPRSRWRESPVFRWWVRWTSDLIGTLLAAGCTAVVVQDFNGLLALLWILPKLVFLPVATILVGLMLVHCVQLILLLRPLPKSGVRLVAASLLLLINLALAWFVALELLAITRTMTVASV